MNRPQATWMDTYAQRTGHYSEEQEKELVKFRACLAPMQEQTSREK